VLAELYFSRPFESIPCGSSELGVAGKPMPYWQTEEKKLNSLIGGIDDKRGRGSCLLPGYQAVPAMQF